MIQMHLVGILRVNTINNYKLILFKIKVKRRLVVRGSQVTSIIFHGSYLVPHETSVYILRMKKYACSKN